SLHGFAVGTRGTFIATTNRGEQWHPATWHAPMALDEEPSFFQQEDFRQVSFGSARRGIAIGKAGLIMQTFDGGLSWAITPAARALRRASPTNSTVLSVAFSSPTNAWVL